MNVRFDDPLSGTITASNTSCGTVTVTEDTTGGGGGGEDGSMAPPDTGGIGIPDDPAVLGGLGLLALIVVALLVI
jgi:hypothetical protein